MKAYCQKCKKNQEMTDQKSKRMQNLVPVYFGKCEVCGTDMIKRR